MIEFEKLSLPDPGLLGVSSMFPLPVGGARPVRAQIGR